MSIVGAGYGAAKALEDILGEQMLRAQIAQREQQQAAEMDMQRQLFAETQKQNEIANRRQVRVDDRLDARDRQASNQAGVRRMIGESLVQRRGPLMPEDRRDLAALQVEAGDMPDMSLLTEPKQKTYQVTVPGPNGPITRLANEDEMRGGVQEYREPKAVPPNYQRVVVDGKETFLTPEEVRARGGVDAASRKRASTGMERTALGYYNRMNSAIIDMDAVEDRLSERDVMLINNSPLPDLVNNRLLSAAGQQYAQALRTYTEARLRKESGAAIPESEFDSDRRTISRQASDQPDALKQKRSTRKRTAEGVAFAAGPAYEEYYGEGFQRSQPDQSAPIRKEIPGYPGRFAESTDGGKTWKAVQ